MGFDILVEELIAVDQLLQGSDGIAPPSLRIASAGGWASFRLTLAMTIDSTARSASVAC